MPGIPWRCWCGMRRRPRTSTRIMRIRATCGACRCIRAFGRWPGIPAARNRRKRWRASPSSSCRFPARPCGGRFAGWRALCLRAASSSIRQKALRFPNWLRRSTWFGKSCPDSQTVTPSFPGRRSPLRWRAASPRRWCSAAATSGLGHGCGKCSPRRGSEPIRARTCRAWSLAARSKTSSPLQRASATASVLG